MKWHHIKKYLDDRFIERDERYRNRDRDRDRDKDRDRDRDRDIIVIH